jgi:hypothetical protein
LKNNPTDQLFQVDTKPEVLSTEKLKSRVSPTSLGRSSAASSQPLSQRIPHSDQERDKLKKLINEIWDYRERKFTMEDMNKKGYDSDTVIAINELFTALHYLVHRSKFQEKLQTLLPYKMPPSNIKYDNTISILKALVDLGLDLTSFQKIKEQLKLGPEYF